jgi:UMF1 family MFS transporter
VLERGWATPKQVLVFNALVIALVFVYILYIKTAADFFAVALIAGTQIGSLGSFSKSIVSKLVPTKRQSRLFSFYQFSQESTGWIGPLIVASIQAGLGGGRRAFLVSTVEVCLVEIAIGVPLLMWVDVKKGEETRAAFDSLELPLGQSSENLND